LKYVANHESLATVSVGVGIEASRFWMQAHAA
jgi:hypothetical protein